MYIKIHRWKELKGGKMLGIYWPKKGSFKLVKLWWWHIRICKSKEEYEQLPHAG